MKVYVPDLTLLETVIFSADVPEAVIDVGLRLAVSPLGAFESASATLPAYWLRGFTVIVVVPVVPVVPALMVIGLGDAEIVKSGVI